MTRAVFDVWLAAPATRASDGVQAIQSSGGVVDYLYHGNVAIIRADLDVDAAKALWTSHVAANVFSVVDYSKHSVRVFVSFDHDLTDADKAALTALGATNPFTFMVILKNTIVVTVDDEAIPAILNLPGATMVDGDGLGCVDSATPTRADAIIGFPSLSESLAPARALTSRR